MMSNDNEPRIPVLKYTSLIPPDVPIPEPPDPFKIVGAIITVLVSISLIAVIVFVVAEFLTDPKGGTPIQARRSATETTDDLADNDDPFPRKPLPTVEEILAQFHIVTPPNFARIEGRWITVLCRWTPPEGSNERDPPVTPQLFCDNSLVPWTMTFGNDVWFARLKTEEAGEHHLRVLSQDLIVYVYDSSEENPRHTAPSRKLLILHEGTDDPSRCGECHVIIEGKNDLVHRSRGLTIGPLRSVETCFSCHHTEDVQRHHATLAEPPGDDCASCHRLHGE